MPQNDNELLIEKLLTSHQKREGFEKIVQQYSQPLYWKIRRMVLTHEDADDILQNTFLKVWTHLDGFEGKARLSTWLYRIAINESLDFLRKQKNIYQRGEEEVTDVAHLLMADEYFDGTEAQALLQEAMAELPEMQKTVFLLKYYDEMKYNEISEVMNKSEGALKANYHLAVKKITDYLKSKG